MRMVAAPRFALGVWDRPRCRLPSPRAFGTPHRVLYGVGTPVGRNAPYFTALHRLDTKTVELESRELAPALPGEPSVAVDADGTSWLLSLVYRSALHRTDLMILRADDLSIQALAPLPHAVPPGFHGCWAESSALP
jgi:carotenoid cleavage dioxygenase-like enzyme